MEERGLQSGETTAGTNVLPAMARVERPLEGGGPGASVLAPTGSRQSIGSGGSGQIGPIPDNTCSGARRPGHRPLRDLSNAQNSMHMNERCQSAPAATNENRKRRRKRECGLEECGVRAGLAVVCSTCSGGVSHAGEVVCDACYAPPRGKGDGSLEWVHLNGAKSERAELFRNEPTHRLDLWAGKDFQALGACLCI